jgi:alpha-D-ribose 1-methylphosphonate 5-triphosphate diphosphatase PhnM
MLLTLGACNSRAGTAAREYALRYLDRRHPDANVFRRLEQRLRETGSVAPAALVNACRSRTVRTPTSEDATIAAVEKLTRYRTRIGTIPTEGTRSTL